MLKEINRREFANGVVYALQTEDGYTIEATDTFLPYYTKNCTNGNNSLVDSNLGDRSERWMIGVSTMSGCPVKCKFCATGSLKKYRNLTAKEIVDQVSFVLSKRTEKFEDAKEHKINYTRMGEPFLNIDNVKAAIMAIDLYFPNVHHYVSTIGIKGSDFSWIKENITLQISVHSLLDEKRNWLIPYNKKMSLGELGKIITDSNQKTTLNMTLIDDEDFDINKLKELFNKDSFFVKLSPINPNEVSDNNNLGRGTIKAKNIM